MSKKRNGTSASAYQKIACALGLISVIGAPTLFTDASRFVNFRGHKDVVASWTVDKQIEMRNGILPTTESLPLDISRLVSDDFDLVQVNYYKYSFRTTKIKEEDGKTTVLYYWGPTSEWTKKHIRQSDTVRIVSKKIVSERKPKFISTKKAKVNSLSKPRGNIMAKK